MSVKSVLETIGSDVKKVFAFIASPAGQAEIAAGEAVVASVYPPAAGLLTLANAGLTEIVKIEGLASAAGQQNGSGTQKLAAVVAAVTPSILQYAEQNKLAQPTAAQIQGAVNALVAFANSFPVA